MTFFKRIILVVSFILDLTMLFGQVPVGDYSLDGNGLDASSGAHHGSVNGTVAVADRFGSTDAALFFDGVGDFITVDEDFDSQERTISVWFNAASISSNTGHVMNIDHANMQHGNAMLRVFTVNGQNVLRYNGGGGGMMTAHDEPILSNQWYMATLVMSPDSCLYYLDCDLVGSSVNIRNTSDDGFAGLVIGSDRDFNPFFHGAIDDLRIYDNVVHPDTICSWTIVEEEDEPCVLDVDIELTDFICAGEGFSATAIVGQEADVSYNWSSDAVQSDVDSMQFVGFITEPGTYELMVEVSLIGHDDCSASAMDSITVLPSKIISLLKMPNVLTPNGDGVNDILRPMDLDGRLHPCEDSSAPRLSIYNRWGMRVYEGWCEWDGFINGQEATEGVYFYSMNVRTACALENETFILRGAFQLLR